MNAAEVKEALYARHPGAGGQFPGAWTVIEEWKGIDLLAISAKSTNRVSSANFLQGLL